MDGSRGRRGRGRGLGRGRWNRSGSEGAGRWSPRSPSFFHPQPPPPPPPPPPSVRDDVCGSGSGSGRNEEERRKTCSEDDTSTPGSGSVGGSGYANNNKNNMKTHDGDGDGDAMMMMPLPQRTSPALDNNIQNRKDEDSSALVTLPDDDSSFDICGLPQQAQAATTVVLKPPLLVTNRERRNQIKRTEPPPPQILRPGMLLFKAHISLSDQVEIVQRCRELGKGSGGFYQPGYREGTKLHLKMMCLGKHWDPQSGQYSADRRPCDGATPPHIPPEFLQLVDKAIAEYHALLQAQEAHTRKQTILPPMSPDICIVNFYSHNGRLGLHQDKDESPESLRQGLPVVSFSIGDSADFLYGDDRDVDKAQKVLLESGDVLIFGGDSRHIFHGVSAIRPMTAPSLLLQRTNLRPGRLNLTFRQY